MGYLSSAWIVKMLLLITDKVYNQLLRGNNYDTGRTNQSGKNQ